MCRSLYTQRYLPRMINLPSRFEPLSYRRSYFNILKFYPKCAVYQNFYHKLPARLFPEPPPCTPFARRAPLPRRAILFALSSARAFRTCPFARRPGKLTANGVGGVQPPASGQNIIRVMRKRGPRSGPHAIVAPRRGFSINTRGSPPTVLCPLSNVRFHREALLDRLLLPSIPDYEYPVDFQRPFRVFNESYLISVCNTANSFSSRFAALYPRPIYRPRFDPLASCSLEPFRAHIEPCAAMRN